MVVRVELFAAGGVPPEDLWGVVGDPRRLPEWTDAERVERVQPDPLEVGTEIVVADGGRSRLWRVVTAQPRLVEVVTESTPAPLGIGVRVVRDRVGSRLVIAGAYHPTGRAQRLRVRLVDAPALRRAFDRWSRRAFELAAAVR